MQLQEEWIKAVKPHVENAARVFPGLVTYGALAALSRGGEEPEVSITAGSKEAHQFAVLWLISDSLIYVKGMNPADELGDYGNDRVRVQHAFRVPLAQVRSLSLHTLRLEGARQSSAWVRASTLIEAEEWKVPLPDLGVAGVVPGPEEKDQEERFRAALLERLPWASKESEDILSVST